jgi:uncharacterized protein (TIRG00374 family)
MSEGGLPTRFDAGALRLTPRRLAALAALGVLTVALLVALSGGRATLAALAGADWRLLALAAAIHYGGFALRGARWQLLLRLAGHRLRYWTVTALLLAGWFASALLPARAGEILRVGVLRAGVDDAPPVPVADGLGSIVLERALDMLAILALGALFGFTVLRAQMPGWVLGAYAAAIVSLGALFVAVLVAPAILRAAAGWSQARWWQAGVAFAARFVASLRSLARRPGATALLVAESLVIWLCDALLMWLAVWSVGTRLPFGSAAFVALTVDILSAVPITPGAIGQIEAVNTALLALLHMPAFNAAAAVLAVRLISYWSFLIVAGAATAAGEFTAYLRKPGTQTNADSNIVGRASQPDNAVIPIGSNRDDHAVTPET